MNPFNGTLTCTRSTTQHTLLHIPQTADGQWTAEWNESLIAKTENSVSSVSTRIHTDRFCAGGRAGSWCNRRRRNLTPHLLACASTIINTHQDMDTHWVGTVSTGNLSEADQAAICKVSESSEAQAGEAGQQLRDEGADD